MASFFPFPLPPSSTLLFPSLSGLFSFLQFSIPSLGCWTRLLTKEIRSTASSPPGIKSTNPISSSFGTTRLSTGATQGYFSVPVSMRMITSWRIWRRYTSLWRFWIASLGTCANWIWFSIFIRCVMSLGKGGSIIFDRVTKEDGSWEGKG